MEIRSLGLRTEVALRKLSGSTVQDRRDHLVIRTPDNPSFWWGNFVVAPAPPAEWDLPPWQCSAHAFGLGSTYS